MNRLGYYLNPISRLGIKKYSFILPAVVSFSICVLSEIFAYGIAHDPMAVGTYIIFLNVAAIIYFSFRDGVRGGFISTVVSILYYFFIIYSRNYQGPMLISGIETTLMLAAVYLFVSAIIGWLKQTIDNLIIREKEARRFAEEGTLRLRTILDQLPVGVLLVDLEKDLVTGNKQLEVILGRKAPNQLITEGAERVYRANTPLLPDSWPIMRAIKKGETVISEEMEYIRFDKKRISLRVNAAPIKNKSKQVIAAVSTLYDITQEKALEKRKDDFVNMASHELKTPLTSMKLYIELLLQEATKSPDQKSKKMLVSLKTQTEKLQELARDLLDVSRIQTGKLNFRKETFRIDELIEETVETLQGTTKNQKLIFSKKSPVTVYADKFRIYQVLTNLITNASKYSPEGEDINLNLKKEKNRVIVSVKDRGMGVSKDQKKKIFERLYQVTDQDDKTYSGLGMGLYISKEIIRRHKGSIWVEGEKGKGSTFFFTLPIEK